MPQYEITSPNGETYEITAPSGATEKEVMEYFQSQMQPQISRSEALATGAAMGVTGGFGDEIKAFVQSIPSRFDGKEGNTYEQILGNVRSRNKAIQKQHPFSYGAGEVGGLLGSGLGAAKLAGKMAPQATGSLAQVASARPYAASAGLGGLGGAVYGYGTGEGGMEQRAKNASRLGALGTIAGPAGAFVSRQVVAPTLGALTRQSGRQTERLSEIGTSSQEGDFSRIMAQQSGEVQPINQQVAPQDFAKMQRSGDEFFTKTKGQRTQDPNVQIIEEDALGNVYGEGARSLMEKTRIQQNREFKGFINKLGDASSDNINELVEKTANTVKTQAKSLKGQINNAYDLAREGGGVKIPKDAIKQGLWARIGDTRRSMGFDLSSPDYTKARKVVKNLAKYSKEPKGTSVNNVKLNALEEWRKMATNAANDAQGSEKAFLNKLVREYDDFMINTANEAADIGDKEAIQAFRNAVSLRRKYGKLFEENKLVDDIATGARNIDDITKNLIGTGSIAGKKQMAENFEALLKAAEEQAPLVRQDMQGAFARKIMNNATSGIEAGGDAAMLSPAKLNSELERLAVNNPEFTKKLYGEDGYKVIKQATEELNRIANKQPNVGNPSGSYYGVARMLRNVGVGRLPGFSLIADAMESAGKQANIKRVEKSVSEFVNDIPQLKPQAPFWGAGTGTAISNTMADQ